MNNLNSATNQNSTPQWTDTIVRASFQIVNTGTSTGSVQLQGSNDQAIGLPANQFTPTNWFNIGSAVTINAAGVFSIAEQELCYEYLQLVYTVNSAGVGSLLARMKSFSF
jgi:hypothetical protein